MHSNVKFPMRLKSNITNICLKWPCALFWDIWGHFMVSHNFQLQNVFICYYCLFSSFPDKNLWFSSQRRREGVVGDANGRISK